MLSKRLRSSRMKCGFTQQYMADKLNLSLNAYQKYEQAELRLLTALLILLIFYRYLLTTFWGATVS